MPRASHAATTNAAAKQPTPMMTADTLDTPFARSTPAAAKPPASTMTSTSSIRKPPPRTRRQLIFMSPPHVAGRGRESYTKTESALRTRGDQEGETGVVEVRHHFGCVRER